MSPATATEGRKRKLSDSYVSDPPPYDAVHSSALATRSDQKLNNQSLTTAQSTVSESAVTVQAPAYQKSPETSSRPENDESAVSAAEVLANLAHSPGAPDSNPESSVTSPMSSTSLADLERQQHPIVSSVTAVSKHPLVTNAVKYYEDSKRNYAPFNYAAGIVEAAAMPVFNKIEVNLNNIHQARLHEARRQKKRRVASPQEKTETKKRLKFCLHILKLASRQIDDKVTCLQRAIEPTGSADAHKHQEQLSTPRSEEKLDEAPVTSQEVPSESELTAVNSTTSEGHNPQETSTEIVTTVKKIIHVISNFRPSSLCADKGADGAEAEDYRLKSTIREIILNLPNQVQSNAGSAGSGQGNDKIMTFANESLKMISKLTTVFNNQLEKVENWMDGEAEGERDEQYVDENTRGHYSRDEKADFKVEPPRTISQ